MRKTRGENPAQENPAQENPATNKERNNKKEIIKKKTTCEHFESFWRNYPKKIDKKRSEAKYKLLSETEKVSAAAGLEKWNIYWEARSEEQFIPHPTTWLNNRRWEAEPPKDGRKKPLNAYQNTEKDFLD